MIYSNHIPRATRQGENIFLELRSITPDGEVITAGHVTLSYHASQGCIQALMRAFEGDTAQAEIIPFTPKARAPH